MLGALLGNYRVVERLGEGGMGVVYVGRHESLGRRVVVKVLRPEMSQKADMVQRFFNEAQAATAINNAGIAQVFDFGTTPDEQAYFVMELLEGETLTARLKQGRLDAVECCRLGRQIANVLAAAHAAGITHRDLKPDNLFLVPDAEVLGGQRVKVLDFGIAKLTGDTPGGSPVGVKTQANQVMGTPSYMAPEQCLSARDADARSDIYSLGCILFRMLCRQLPFTGQRPIDILSAHVNSVPPRPEDLVPGIPTKLSALIMKMLEKQRASRPQSMAEVSEALAEILCELGELAARPSAGLLPVQGRSSLPSEASPTLPGLPPDRLRGSSPSLSPPMVRDTAPSSPRTAETTTTRVLAPRTVTIEESTEVEVGCVTAPMEPAEQLPPASQLSAVTRSVSLPLPLPPPLPTPMPRERAEPLSLPPRLAADASARSAALEPPFTRETDTETGSEMARMSTTLSGAVASGLARAPRTAGRRASVAVIGLVLAGSVVMAIVLATGDALSVSGQVSSQGVSRSPVLSSAPSITVTPLPEPVAQVPPPELRRVPVDASARVDGQLQARCVGLERARQWRELGACADQLAAIDADRAAPLRRRVAEELRAAPRVAAVEVALRARDLDATRAALEQLSPHLAAYADLKRMYEGLERQAIDQLVAKLGTVKDSSCEMYRFSLAQAQVDLPVRVVEAAARRRPCVPVPKCDVDALLDRGRDLFAVGDLAAAFATYETAHTCRPSPDVLQQVLLVACHLRDVSKAKLAWQGLPELHRARTAAICVRNGISEAALNMP